MEGKRLVQAGAAAFVGLAVAMTLVQLRQEPVPAPVLPPAGRDREADTLAMQLRACSAMGEEALSSPFCRAAWAEKRRRFFGVPHPDAYGEPGVTTVPGSPAVSVTASRSN